MAEFKRLTGVELDRMGDEEVVAYIAAARDAGDTEASREAMAILAHGYEPQIKGRVAKKTPLQAVDDVAMDVLESLLRSTFDGKVIGEFRKFLFVIVDRRVADYHRKHQRDRDQVPLPIKDGDEEIWGEEASVEDSTDLIALLDAIARVRATRNPVHQRIIELYGAGIGEGLTAAETVERMASEGEIVSVDNVQQVWHRFKKDLEAELASGEDGGNPDV